MEVGKVPQTLNNPIYNQFRWRRCVVLPWKINFFPSAATMSFDFRTKRSFIGGKWWKIRDFFTRVKIGLYDHFESTNFALKKYFFEIMQI